MTRASSSTNWGRFSRRRGRPRAPWRCSSSCSRTPATTATSPPASSAWRRCRREADIRTVSRLLFAAYFLEAGFILMVAPWSQFWERNRFAADRPALETIVMSPYARGGVTGVGVITALAGFAELGAVILSRGRRPDSDSIDNAPDR